MIPASFRELIAANYSPKLYITYSPSLAERCLHIYPLEEWVVLQEKVRALPKMDKFVRVYIRRVIASAVESSLDKQGRVLVPQAQRFDSGIKGEVVVVGAIDKLEVWDKTQWEEANDPSKIDHGAYEDTLSRFGI